MLEHINFKFTAADPFFFKDLAVSFEPNKIHFVRGANGSGKSTLFRLIQGKIDKHEFASGALYIAGQKYMLCPGMNSTAKVSLVQQKFDLMLADQLSFTDNLRLANMPCYPGLAPLPEHQPLPDLIKRFGIAMHKPVSLLSGGQRQILAILMALQRPVKVLLLDEPTAALDNQNAQMVMQFLKDLVSNFGLTVLIICHDKELVKTYASGGHFELSANENTKLRTISFISF